MNIDRLIAYTRDPSNIGRDDTEDLEQLLADYPYFTAAQHLLALKYRKQNSSRYNRQAQRAASQAPDQLRLAFLLEEPLAQWSSQLKTWTEEGLNVVSQPKVTETFIAEVSAEDINELVAGVEEVVLETRFEEASKEASIDLKQADVEALSVDSTNEETAATAKEETVEPQESSMSPQQEPVTLVDANPEILQPISHPEEVKKDSSSTLNHEDLAALTAPVVEPVVEALVEPEPVELEVEKNQVNDTPELEDELVVETMHESENQEVLELASMSNPVNELTLDEEPIPELEEQGVKVEMDEFTTPKEQEVVLEPEPVVSSTNLDTSERHSFMADEDIKSPIEEQEFLKGRHERTMWFRFFAGKPWREQPEDVLEEMYMQHMAGDFLQAKSADFEEIKEELKAVINHEPEVKRDVAMEAEIRRLAWESVSDEELPASETLAKIYEEQKDYKKALRIYQKLMLKFPDRMTYFAALVENAKSKLNH